MFGVFTIDGRTYIIVKKEIIPNGGMPNIGPFETYGLIYKQEGCGKTMFSIITKSPEVEAEEVSLIQEALKTKPIFNDII